MMRRDFSTPPVRKNKKMMLVVCLVLAVLVWLFISSLTKHSPVEKGGTATSQNAQPPFPEISTNSLTKTQRKMLDLIREEYAKAPRSFDNTVLTYTEGIRESWCADFISWIYLKSGVPLVNPNSQYWRIPGVLTLQQYYRSNQLYTEVSSGYKPKLGDVAFYIGAQTPDNSSEEHAAIVLAIEGETLATIGGNEANGIMRVRTETLQQNINKGLVGFGQLDS